METFSDALQALGLGWAGVAAGVGLLLLLLLAFLWKRRRTRLRQQLALEERSATVAQRIAPPTLPQKEKRAADEAPSQAELLRAERQQLEAQAKAQKEKEAREAFEAQARALKEQEEEAKRLAYRQKKEAEAQAKAEKQRQEAEEALRREEEARLAKQRQEEEEREKAAREAGKTLSEGLMKTRKEGFLARLGGLFGGTPRSIDAALLGELEELLFSADIGVHTASRLLAGIEAKAKKKELADLEAIRHLLKAEIAAILNLPPAPSAPPLEGPEVWMVVGVNGSGKTTSIGKLAAQAKAQGRKVVLAAADTFRAAATEQLEVWAGRTGALLVQGKEEGDPASVAFEGVKKAREEAAQLVVVDTAGRLHTKQPLMEELRKIHRVLGKAQAGAPHQVLLVLDATMGQNAIAQAKQFSEAVAVTQIVLTKLDGTAKGGVVIGICDELKLPVGFIGIGERAQDLRPFSPAEFVEALFEEP
ncbi:MAG: signal recognition particle-docking protein FtsY [Cystobacterineae bacterium]|nr:signal recognition particle-docking protein FtsY [Cystobacterineae bacterium]